jgi:hypothetical protein
MTPALSYHSPRSLYSGMILALLVLAFLLQASFFVGLASGRAAGPAPLGAESTPVVSAARG